MATDSPTVPRRRKPRTYVAASTPPLTAEEAENIARNLDTWPGSYARVLIKDTNDRWVPIPGGYRPFAPPPPGVSFT